MTASPFQSEVSRQIWDSRYRYRSGGAADDRDVRDSWRRVARALAAAEPQQQTRWSQRFYDLLADFRFLPGGRILAGAGTGLDVTLFNCFVMGRIEDSMEGIFEALKQGALTMQQGGGVGYDFTTLRPAGTPAWRVGGTASGPVSFMHIWDAMCETLLSTASRRGAMMATLRCDHPDIETFVAAKRHAGRLRNFNLSVLVSDAFMQAVHDDAGWPLVFPAAGLGATVHRAGRRLVQRTWPGHAGDVDCVVLREVAARDLWDRIMRASYETAEPGVLFIDRINRQNNLGYREQISATNPCGEIPLPPYGACNLGSLNLTAFICEAFTGAARIDVDALRDATATAVRLLDNVIDRSRFPLPQQADQARGSRRIGLGITGLADSLIMLGLHYDSDAARQRATEVMRVICHTAYRTSIALATEKGSFPFFDSEALCERPFIRGLPADIRDAIATSGLRNSHLTAIAPTGTISLLANNVSSGIEPVFDFEHRRRIRDRDDGAWYELTDFTLAQWRARCGDQPLPEHFVDARHIPPDGHLAMQAAVQPYVDNAISKTINVGADIAFDAYRSVYEQAFRLGLKGCTTFRPNPVTGSVLETAGRDRATGPPCCGLDRSDD